MKKALILTLVLAFAFTGLIVGTADAKVANSWHDFSTNSWTWSAAGTGAGDGDLLDSATTQMCVFCHHPHRTAGGGTIFTNMVLWNQVNQNASYATYNATTSASINGPASTLSFSGEAARSYLCMACHDGDIAVDALVAAPGDGSNIATAYTLGTGAGKGNLGSSLEDDHPVNILYNTTDDAGLNTTITAGKVAGLYPLYNNTVQCASCHDVHDGATTQSTGVQFMRILGWETSSKICTDCHADK